MNVIIRNRWIDNDDGLHTWWRISKKSKKDFINENQKEIDVCIENIKCG
jgi:hypothetical protein